MMGIQRRGGGDGGVNYLGGSEKEDLCLVSRQH